MARHGETVRRTHVLAFRVSDVEARLLRAAARYEGMPLVDWARALMRDRAKQLPLVLDDQGTQP